MTYSLVIELIKLNLLLNSTSMNSCCFLVTEFGVLPCAELPEMRFEMVEVGALSVAF